MKQKKPHEIRFVYSTITLALLSFGSILLFQWQTPDSTDFEQPRTPTKKNIQKPTPLHNKTSNVATKVIKENKAAPAQPRASLPKFTPTSSVIDQETQLQAIRLHVDQGRIDDAIELLKVFIQSDPNNEAALMELAMIQLIDQQSPYMARETLENLIRLNPHHHIALVELLGLYEDHEQIEDGIFFLKNIHSQNPNATKVALALGQIYTQEGSYHEATVWLEKASISQEDKPTALTILADIWLEVGSFEKSWETFERLVDYYHKSPQQDAHEQVIATRMGQIELLLDMERFDEAKANLTTWIQNATPEEQAPLSELMNILQKAQG